MSNPTADFMLTLHIARILYREHKESYAEETAYHAANGHRNSHCVHGTYQWTDYDNICGGCEEGQTMLNMAVHRAAYIVREWHDRIATATLITGKNMPYDVVDRDALGKWTMEPVQRYLSMK